MSIPPFANAQSPTVFSNNFVGVGTNVSPIDLAGNVVKTVQLTVGVGALVFSTSGGLASATIALNGLSYSAGTLINNLILGIAGVQTVIGGVNASDNLNLSSTSNATKGVINADSPLAINNTPVSVAGSTSGTASFSQVQAGAGGKEVIVYLAALLGTASYTFPVAFTHTPDIVTTNGPGAAIVTSLSTTAMTVTGTTTTGFIVLKGW